jgi:hypothetical protein
MFNDENKLIAWICPVHGKAPVSKCWLAAGFGYEADSTKWFAGIRIRFYFDEIEKLIRRYSIPYSDVDDGRLTDAKGRIVNFKIHYHHDFQYRSDIILD